MVMNTWNQSKNISSLDTEQDTVMEPFEKDFKSLGVIEQLSFCKAPTSPPRHSRSMLPLLY